MLPSSPAGIAIGYRRAVPRLAASVASALEPRGAEALALLGHALLEAKRLHVVGTLAGGARGVGLGKAAAAEPRRRRWPQGGELSAGAAGRQEFWLTLPTSKPSKLWRTPSAALAQPCLTMCSWPKWRLVHVFEGLELCQLPSAVVEKFKECLISGAPTPEEDQKACEPSET